MTTLHEILVAALKAGGAFADRGWLREKAAGGIESVCRELLSSRGEVSGIALAAQILERFLHLDRKAQDEFFSMLANRLDIDADAAVAAAEAYQRKHAPAILADLVRATEPSRQELFRRLNLAPGGTATLVEMRRLLMLRLRDNPDFKRVDADLEHLFHSWFNRGFLSLRAITWKTPAHILEKLIAYEAIHEINDWAELRRRLQPEDRRCFGFFHPAMPDEPLIFVEVALMRDTPSAVREILQESREILDSANTRTAVFYSISKCHRGLSGVSFGSFLIKQAAQTLAHEIPSLKAFVTLSPMPDFMDWLRAHAQSAPAGIAARAMNVISNSDWRVHDKKQAAEKILPPLAAEYFLRAKADDGRPPDRVARFHLRNGAMLERINFLADDSPVRLAQSAGMMVNYRYHLDKIDVNHESFAERGIVRASRSVRALLARANQEN